MKVIKVVEEHDDGRLYSTFAHGEWEKEYAQGVETKPDIGYLFAFPKVDLRGARSEMGIGDFQYWLAEAEVVGRISHADISVSAERWNGFWEDFKLQPQTSEARYLLCSSITLIKRIE